LRPTSLLPGLLLGFGLLSAGTAAGQRKVDLGALQLKGLDGKPFHLPVAGHRAVILNFWAPWCPPCREEIPWFQALQQAQPEGVLVIGVVADPDEYGRAAAFMQSQHVTYRLARLSPQLVEAFGEPAALPETFYLSSTGEVVHAVQGVAPRETMLQFAADAERNAAQDVPAQQAVALQTPR
jgi:thiol-disulfide isomerase/thioredoxin